MPNIQQTLFAHHRCAKQQVRVVGDQCPGQPWREGFCYECAQSDKKLGTVGRGAE